jgi:hypothetical protein
MAMLLVYGIIDHMEKLTHYRQLIKELLNHYAEIINRPAMRPQTEFAIA